MRYLFLLLIAVALSMVSLVYCGDESGVGGSGGGGGTGGVSTTPRIVVIKEWSPLIGLVGVLQGVKICGTDTGDCVLTDAAGRATVQIPIGREFSFTLDKEGEAPFLLPDFDPSGVELFPTFGMVTDQRQADMHARVMSPYPMEGTGSIVIVFEPRFSTIATGCVGVAGVTLDLADATGKRYYYDEQGNWDADLTATTCWGWGGFTEVTPGIVEVEIGGNAEGCVVLQGWPGEVENSVRMPIQAGYLTRVRVACDAPE
jgi:hypothetical protein